MFERLSRRAETGSIGDQPFLSSLHVEEYLWTQSIIQTSSISYI